MPMRTKVLGLVDVMMRVPPILVIDEILKLGMGLPAKFYPGILGEQTNSTATKNDDEVINDTLAPLKSLLGVHHGLGSTIAEKANLTKNIIEKAIDNASATAIESGMLSSSFNSIMDNLAKDSNLSNILGLTSVKFVLCLLAFFGASCVFMLWTRHLVLVYMFLTSLWLTILSYWSNSDVIKIVEANPNLLINIMSMDTTRLLVSRGVILQILPHLLAQWFMGTLFAYIHLGPRYSSVQKAMPFIFSSPIMLIFLPLPPRILRMMPVVAGIVPLLLTKISIFGSAIDTSRTIYNGYQYAVNFVSNFGLSALVENEWQRLNVPSVLRVFWTIRVAQGFYTMATMESDVPLELLPTAQKLLVDGCETLTAVLGMTAVISAMCHYIGRSFQWYLLTVDNDEEKSLGTVSAVLFYILALQTGLTSLTPEKRFIRLCRNLCLLVTALLHFLHNIVSPILMSLSAARNPSRQRHIRALSVCAFLILVPVCLLYILWTQHLPSTWLLAVTAFSIEVIVKVLVSLATYSLFLLDARRQFFWEKLDDYLYYVRAFGNSVEFCFGILLFLNGAWILVFESAQNAAGGAIRAIMMCIHAYFNIWCEARAGWTVFIKRRSAVHKIKGLPEATPAQLQAFDDVCAICYQEMYTAKITRCRHFFHGVCLRKWLYVQDRCPLCHEIMMYTDKPDEETNEGNQSEEDNPLHIYQGIEDEEPPPPRIGTGTPEHNVRSQSASEISGSLDTTSTNASLVASASVGSPSTSGAGQPNTATAAAAGI